MAKVDPKKNHIHRYILREQGPSKRLVYKCERSEKDGGACGHYLPAGEAIGRQSICWRCGDTCIISAERANRFIKRPHCVTCTKVYKGTKASSVPIDLKKLAEMDLSELMGNDDLFNPDKKKEH